MARVNSVTCDFLAWGNILIQSFFYKPLSLPNTMLSTKRTKGRKEFLVYGMIMPFCHHGMADSEEKLRLGKRLRQQSS
jgi:hypothetical protein